MGNIALENLLKIVIVDINLDRELSYLLLLNNRGIECIIRMANQFIPLSFQDDVTPLEKSLDLYLVQIFID